MFLQKHSYVFVFNKKKKGVLNDMTVAIYKL